MRTLDVRTVAAWRKWLAAHHDAESEIWLVFHKLHTGTKSIDYKDALDEALCFGWIDSLIKRIDDDRYARKFTPRKPVSRWSVVNIKRYAELAALGRLMPPGLARAPTGPALFVPPAAAPLEVPKYILAAIAKNPAAKKNFATLAPSYRRDYVRWVEMAKREETKQRRLAEAVARIAAGDKPGLK